jgi:hypothetical protein
MKPAEIVRAESPSRIRDHFNREARFNPTASLTALTGQLTQEYEDRFLVEMVQNAYDAQASEARDGRVHVRLDESADAGAVLFVANTGRPFADPNFDALTNVAQSSKPPGEGIGNKGIGFKSVIQVCESPEIYSCDPVSSNGVTFDGYCFGFATDEQILAMTGDEKRRDVIKTDFSRYLLPVEVSPTDPYLVELRSQGMVTVIRLPLDDSRAIELARDQVNRLLEPSPPIALFLDRLQSISVDHIGAEGELKSSQIDRSVLDIKTVGLGPRLKWVETAGTRYLTTTRVLKSDDVSEVVKKAIELRELDDSWSTWDSDVEVSLAILVPQELPGVIKPMTYTYLPMRAPAPLHAHLHAPFHTKMARLALNEESSFNSYLIDIAADLAAETVAYLASDVCDGIELEIRQAAAVDLLCWDAEHVSRLVDALDRRGLDVETSCLIPGRGPDGADWSSLAKVSAWDEPDLRVISRALVESKTWLVAPSLDADRVRRLGVLRQHLMSRDLMANDDEVATWIEQIAAGLSTGSVARWNQFLSDVAVLFSARKATALQRRHILLDEQRRLRRAGPWDANDLSTSDPTVFIPPPPVGSRRAAAEDDDFELENVPRNLQRAITYLHHDIKVRVRDGSTWKRTAVGELLRSANLVEPFELAAVLGHLQRLLSGKVSDRTYRQALSWVYAQERASRSNIADLARLELRVPTATGWLPAARTVFSPEWQTPRASTVAQLVIDAAGISSTIEALGEGAILPPAAWPFRIHDQDLFAAYLARCGVRDGLFPIALRSRTAIRMNGTNYSPEGIAFRFAFQDDGEWAEHVKDVWRPLFEGPHTPYTGSQDLWVVPGQDAFADLSDAAKDRLAAAIFESVSSWSDATWSYVFRRQSPHHRAKPDPQSWPSPARTFIEKASWFPMSDAGRRSERYFVPVHRAWTFDETGENVAPRFARLAPIEHRRRLAASPAAGRRLSLAGLKDWSDPNSAGNRLGELAALVESEGVAEAELLSIRRAATKAWSDLVRLGQPALPARCALVVTAGPALETREPTVEPTQIYVQDVPPGLVAQVLEAGHFSVLVADPADGDRVAAALSALPGYMVRRTSTVEASIVLDGEKLTPSEATGAELLGTFGSWLLRTVLAIVDIRSTRFTRITDKVLHEAEARIRRMRLAIGSTIDLTVDGRTLPATGRLAECVHVNHPEHPLLVLRRADFEVPSWRALEVVADDLADLMGQAQAAAEIRAAALALQRSVDEWREPTDLELAQALRCAPEAVTDVLKNLRTSTDELRHLIAPFVGVLAGVESARRLEDEPVGSVDELKGLLAQLVGPENADGLWDAASRAESIDDIRRETSTNLGTLNHVLFELRRPRLHFKESNEASLRAYLNDDRVTILQDLRLRFLAEFDAFGDLTAYVEARDFHDLMPDSGWLDEFEYPPAEVLAAHVDQWMAAKGVAADVDRSGLSPIDEVRDANALMLGETLGRMATIVEAWSIKSGLPRSEAWLERQHVRDALGMEGCLDFRELQESHLISWLVQVGLWPAGMPSSADPDVLGLGPTDLKASESSSAASAQTRRRRRTELMFAEQSYDTAASDELRRLIEAVVETADERFLGTRSTPRRLLPMATTKRTGGSGGSGGGPKSYAGGQLSEEKASAIGLAGEVLAYRWLQRAYEETTPDSWVSANRTFELGGHPGDDGLGYDFRVMRKSETLFFEVKATTTDSYEFDFGESELRAARAARKGWYRIIFIRSVLDPAQRELLVLPNPLEFSTPPTFSQINRGVRLKFDPGNGR